MEAKAQIPTHSMWPGELCAVVAPRALGGTHGELREKGGKCKDLSRVLHVLRPLPSPHLHYWIAHTFI